MSCRDDSDWLAAAYVGDPVSVVTGANVLSTLDFRLTGPLMFEWTRRYDSEHRDRDYALGWGHSHDYDRRLEFDVDGVRHIGPLGRATGFPPLLADGDHESRAGLTLRRVSAAEFDIIDSRGLVATFRFRRTGEAARLHRLANSRGRIEFGYDAAARLVSILDSTGRHILVDERPDGRVQRLVWAGRDGKQNRPLIAYSYDDAGNLIQVIDRRGNAVTFSYDGDRRLVSRREPSGYGFNFEYEGGRCVRSSGDDGLHDVRLRHSPGDRSTIVTRADGGIWTYAYDERGAVVRITDPYGGERSFTQDSSGRMAAESDQNGNVSALIYDSAGALVARRNPFGHVTLLPESPNVRDPWMEPVASRSSEWEYGRLVDLSTTALPWPAASVLRILPSALRESVRVAATDARWVAVEPPAAVPPLGPRWWPAPRRGRVFDDFGKLVGQYDPDGKHRKWTYDDNGNVRTFDDFDGRHFEFERRSWDLLVREVDPLGGQTTYAWTATQQIAAVVDAMGSRHDFDYDQKDRLSRVRRHGVVKEEYRYDRADNLIEKLDGAGRSLMKCEIGERNLVMKKTFSSGGQVHTFAYDAMGRCIRSTVGATTLEFDFDEAGNRVADKRDGAGVEHRFSQRYRVARTRVFDRFTTRYARIDSTTLQVTDPTGHRHTVRLLGHGLVHRSLSNGSDELTQYDHLGRCIVKSISQVGRAGRAWIRRYYYSGEGDLVRIEDNRAGQATYEYDACHRLTRANAPNGSHEMFAYDRAGNLRLQPGLDGVSFLDGNRLAAANGKRFEYNTRNHVHKCAGVDDSFTYSYDDRGLLTGVEGGTLRWRSEYDPFARRVRKTLNDATTEFYWDGDRLACEIAPNGRCRIYVYLDQFALTPFMFIDYQSMTEDPVHGRAFFLFCNQIGTPVLVEDEQGTPAWQATIRPYGRADIADGATVDLSLRFPGHYLDEELRLHCNRYRHYSPILGRYLQSDPIGISGGLNLYAYSANPLGSVDVLGFCPECDAKARAKADREDNKRLKEDIAAAEDLGIIDKPPNAPNYQNWIAKGGRVELSHDGSITYVRADGVAVTYRDGYPDFSPYMNHPSGVTSVEITQTTNRSADFRAANTAAGHPEWGNESPPRYTWHHNENGTTMQLLPRDVHGDFTHAGGVSNVGDDE